VFPFGDVDCNGQVNSVDSLKILRYGASLSYSQNNPCPDIGSGTLPNGKKQGDIDCKGIVTSVDALKILRYGATLPYSQNEPPPCPNIGS
jgi:hypothetical protein